MYAYFIVRLENYRLVSLTTCPLLARRVELHHVRQLQEPPALRPEHLELRHRQRGRHRRLVERDRGADGGVRPARAQHLLGGVVVGRAGEQRPGCRRHGLVQPEIGLQVGPALAAREAAAAAAGPGHQARPRLEAPAQRARDERQLRPLRDLLAGAHDAAGDHHAAAVVQRHRERVGQAGVADQAGGVEHAERVLAGVDAARERTSDAVRPAERNHVRRQQLGQVHQHGAVELLGVARAVEVARGTQQLDGEADRRGVEGLQLAVGVVFGLRLVVQVQEQHVRVGGPHGGPREPVAVVLGGEEGRVAVEELPRGLEHVPQRQHGGLADGLVVVVPREVGEAQRALVLVVAGQGGVPAVQRAEDDQAAVWAGQRQQDKAQAVVAAGVLSESAIVFRRVLHGQRRRLHGHDLARLDVLDGEHAEEAAARLLLGQRRDAPDGDGPGERRVVLVRRRQPQVVRGEQVVGLGLVRAAVRLDGRRQAGKLLPLLRRGLGVEVGVLQRLRGLLQRVLGVAVLLQLDLAQRLQVVQRVVLREGQLVQPLVLHAVQVAEDVRVVEEAGRVADEDLAPADDEQRHEEPAGRRLVLLVGVAAPLQQLTDLAEGFRGAELLKGDVELAAGRLGALRVSHQGLELR